MCRYFFKTIPQSRLTASQLPLHKGAFPPMLLNKRNACTVPIKGLCRHLLFCVAILR